MKTNRRQNVTSGFWVVALLCSRIALGAQPGDSGFVYQGRAFDGNNYPLNGTVDFYLKILSPNGCVLYSEKQLGVNLHSSSGDGFFALNVGSATGSGKRTAADPGKSMAAIFSNDATAWASAWAGVQLKDDAGTDCAYTPASGDGRALRVKIYNPSTTGTITLSPDLSILGSPFAMMAETIQGIPPSGLLQPNSAKSLTQANLEKLTHAEDVSALHHHDSAYAKLSGSSSLTLSPGSFVGLGNFATDPGGLGSGDAGKTWYNSTDGLIKYWTGNEVKTLGTSGVASFNGRTGAVTLTQPDAKTALGAASGTNDGYLAGADWTAFNNATTAVSNATSLSTPNTIVKRDGSGNFSAGTITANVTGNVSGSAASFTGSLTGDVTGTQSATQVIKIQGKVVSLTGLADGKVLKWNAAANSGNGQWEPGDASTATGSVTSVGLALPGEFTVSNSPVTSTGTLTGAWANQAAMKVFAGPKFGEAAAAPSFRLLEAADLPSITAAQLPALTGDVTSSAGSAATTVTKIQGKTIVGTGATDGQVLKWNSAANAGAGQWEPGAAASGTVTSVTGSAPLTNGGTASAPEIGITKADTSHDGYLSSTDWNTFNGMLPLTGGTLVGNLTLTGATKVTAPAFKLTTGAQAGYVLTSDGNGDAAWTAPTSVGVVDTSKLPLAGGTMTGDLNMGTKDITNAGSVTATAFTGALTGNVTGNVSGTAANVTGTVAIANGGTGQATKAAAFDALSPTTAKGDLIAKGATNNIALPVGSDGNVLTADSTQVSGLKWAAAPSDATKLPLAGGTMTGDLNMGTKNITNAGTITATTFSGNLSGNAATATTASTAALATAADSANGLVGHAIDSTGLADGKMLVYSTGAGNKWVVQDPATGSQGPQGPVGPPGGYLPMTEVTATSASASVNTGYITNNASRVAITLPAGACAIGDRIKVVGRGAGGWRISQNAGQKISNYLGNATQTGTGGYIASKNARDSAELLCMVADGSDWQITYQTDYVVFGAGAGSCPTDWVYVPGDGTFGTSDFCVMKYEAKSNAGAKSEPAGAPWVSIMQSDALTACANLGGGYSLISNAQWMTIARNIEQVAANWSGDVGNGYTGAVGVGTMNRGHSDSSASALSVGNVNDPCDGTGDAGCAVRSNAASAWLQKRSHQLSTGAEIWDMGGNVWEWVSDLVSGASFSPALSSAAWVEYNTANFNLVNATNRLWFAPSQFAYTSSQGMGQFYGGSGGAVYRGGAWNNATNAGIFTAALHDAASSSGTYLGFRCVKSLP